MAEGDRIQRVITTALISGATFLGTPGILEATSGRQQNLNKPKKETLSQDLSCVIPQMEKGPMGQNKVVLIHLAEKAEADAIGLILSEAQKNPAGEFCVYPLTIQGLTDRGASYNSTLGGEKLTPASGIKVDLLFENGTIAFPAVLTGRGRQVESKGRSEAQAEVAWKNPNGIEESGYVGLSAIKIVLEKPSGRGGEMEITGTTTEKEKGKDTATTPLIKTRPDDEKSNQKGEVDALFVTLEKIFFPQKIKEQFSASCPLKMPKFQNSTAAKLEKMIGVNISKDIEDLQKKYTTRLAEYLSRDGKINIDLKYHENSGNADLITVNGVAFNLNQYSNLNTVRTLLELQSLNQQTINNPAEVALRSLAIDDLLWLGESGFLDHITHNPEVMEFLQPYQMVEIARALRAIGLENLGGTPKIVFSGADISGMFILPDKIEFGLQNNPDVAAHELLHFWCYEVICKMGVPDVEGIVISPNEMRPGEKVAVLGSFYMQAGQIFEDLAKKDPVAELWYNYFKRIFKGKEFAVNGVERSQYKLIEQLVCSIKGN